MKTLLKNVNLLDGTKDMVLRKGVNILIEDGVFTKITSDNIEDNVDKTYDLTNKYLTPGLINLHVHLPASGFPKKKQTDSKKLATFVMSNPLTRIIGKMLTASGAKTQLLAGCTTIRTVGGLGNIDSQIRDEINAGKRIGPRLIACNSAITVKGGHMEGSVAYGADSIPEMIDFIDNTAKSGADWIKIMITGGVLDSKKIGEPGEMKMTYEQVKACVDEAHKLGLKTCAHIESPEGIKCAIECGVDSIEHGSVLTEDLIKKCKENKAVIVTTLSAAIPIVYFDLNMPNEEMAKVNGKVILKGMIDCVKDALANDIIIGLGTDTGCPLVTHYDMWRELEYYHHYAKVSREFALYTATLLNARILGLDNIIGSIEEGKQADFIVCNDSPLDGFMSLKNLEMVSKGKQIIEHPRVKKSEEAELKLNDFYNKLVSGQIND